MRKIVFILLFMASPVCAQEFDSDTWRRIVVHIQQQRDNAIIAAATAEAQLEKIKAELERLKADKTPK